MLLGGTPLSGVTFAITDPGVCTDTDSSGDYQCTVPHGWAGTVTPVLSGYLFVPASMPFTNVAEDIELLDFVAIGSDEHTIWGDSAVPEATGFDNAPLRALADGEDGPNGVYSPPGTNLVPAQGLLASNFWVDVVFFSVWPQ